MATIRPQEERMKLNKELNYDLIPEELKRKAVDLLVDKSKTKEFVKIWDELEKEIKATQQTKKPVDMAVLVNSGVLCEFSDFGFDGCQYLGILEEAKTNGAFYCYGGPWLYCRPLYGHWHSARNFDDVEGLILKLKDAGFCVGTDKSYGVIEHFRITGMQPDFCEPWRCKQ